MQRALVSFLIFAVAAGAMLPMPARAEDRFADLPCVKDGTKPEDRRPDQFGLRFCSQASADIRTRAQTTLQKQVDQYYQGCIVDPRAPYNPDPKACPGKVVAREVCNPYPGTFNGGVAEGIEGVDVNHQGNACGEWSKLETRLEIKSPEVAICRVTPDHSGNYYKREDGLTRGNWVHAINCHWEQVKNEIARNQLKLTSVGGVDGPCSVMSKDFEGKRVTADAQAKAFQKELGERKNIVDIDNCNDEVSSKMVESPDVGRLRQSACQLAAGRAVLEGMFTYLAVCEVISRAERSYQEFLASVGDKKIFYGAVKEQMSTCMGKQRGDKSCNPTAVFQECYYPQLMSFLKARADKIWNAGVCQ